MSANSINLNVMVVGVIFVPGLPWKLTKCIIINNGERKVLVNMSLYRKDTMTPGYWCFKNR